MLPEIIALCKTYDAMLMVDDAHGIGVMGENGKGTVEHFNCLEQVDIITGTFSKSFGGVGGFVAASKNSYNISVFMQTVMYSLRLLLHK